MLRLRGDYLAIVTLAFGEIIRLVIINWQSLTGGPNGVTGIPRPTLFGIPLTPGDDGLAARLGIEFSPTHRIVFLFYLILALALLTNWVTIRLRRLPIGRAWERCARRGRLPRARHQHHHDQADGVCDRRYVRRVCRCVLRTRQGFIQPGILHLP